jgi:hypothetical protein
MGICATPYHIDYQRVTKTIFIFAGPTCFYDILSYIYKFLYIFIIYLEFL